MLCTRRTDGQTDRRTDKSNAYCFPPNDRRHNKLPQPSAHYVNRSCKIDVYMRKFRGGHLPQCGPSAQAPIAGDANAAECCVNLRRCWHQVCFSSNCCCRLLLGAYSSISSQYMGGGSMILVWEAHWQGVWERNSPSKVQGQSPGRAETQRMLYHEAKIHLWREKNKSQYRLT